MSVLGWGVEFHHDAVVTVLVQAQDQDHEAREHHSYLIDCLPAVPKQDQYGLRLHHWPSVNDNYIAKISHSCNTNAKVCIVGGKKLFLQS